MAQGIMNRDNGSTTSYSIPSQYITGASAGDVNILSCGRICICRFITSLVATGGTGWTEIFQFPPGYRPYYMINVLVNDDSKGSVGGSQEAKVSYDDNNFQIYSPVQGHKYWGSFVYFRE